MSFTFTTRLPLSRHAVDRDHLSRDLPGLFDQLWADAATRVLPVWRGKMLLAPHHPSSADTHETTGVHLTLLPPTSVPNTGLRVYLGQSLPTDLPEPAGTRIIAVQLDDDSAARLEPDEQRWVGLRTVATALDNRDAGLFTETLGLFNWHASHAHCPRCGAATLIEQGGWVRRCPVDNSQVFPRTDPAVIVLITDADDRILLGSNAMWENNRYSLLAGFVEPGEALESAVIREMFEESGLRVTDPAYVGSQPWPFPASVMCGFTARLADDQPAGDLLPDGAEILALRWFSRQELRDAGEWMLLPGPSSIALAMIERWLGAPLPVASELISP
ncbi:MAG: NAD(+) diphosphatase [Cryobacterium sp.]|uniref:NAD(+) diphosphatase n=1 Tax=unclassified Cryobacterium TaxID=2649013 RepID=UPI0018CA0586|nr:MULTISPECIES: NAD(+) diphosphatase [unclassified Cryobacterium]MCY7403197.1 NAD(+) diphosphatase [Cryobacterium sp.]MEC5152971.1 NAD+ diphosphatase [Cryobacterium sp. CAN_C3]